SVCTVRSCSLRPFRPSALSAFLAASCFLFFFFNHTATTEIYTLSLHDALPISIDVLPRTPGNNVYVGFMVWSNFTATKCRGLVSLNQVIKEIICLQPLK